MLKKLPSPKWLAFGTVVSAGVGGIAYDKYEQSQIRTSYMDKVSKSVAIDSNMKPRRLLILVAPPPNDYLETSMKLALETVDQTYLVF